MTFEEWKILCAKSFGWDRLTTMDATIAKAAWNAAIDEAKKEAYGCLPQGMNPIGPLHSAGMSAGVKWAIERIEKLHA